MQEDQQTVEELVNEVSSLVDTLQEQQEQQAQQEQQVAEEQKKEEEITQKTIQLLESQNKSLDALVQTFSEGSETTTTENQQILQKLDEIYAKMDDNSKLIAEAGWMVTLAVVLAVGLKLFWDNVLKW
jgi:Domain of unknown function (DUF1910)